DGLQGLALARGARPDVVLLDVMLPSMDGFQLCRTLRQESAVPIIMLTARGQELDRVMGLELGADDYVVKPFSFRELMARVRAALRRRALDRGEQSTAAEQMMVGDVTLDRAARLVWRGRELVELTPREFSLLAELLDRVWGASWVGDPRTLDVHVRWLREKLEADPSAPRYLQTVRGYGYRFVDPAAPAHAP